jgi:hypothetical protein
MYKPYPLHQLHYPRLDAAIDFGVALWRWLRLTISPARPPVLPRHR